MRFCAGVLFAFVVLCLPSVAHAQATDAIRKDTKFTVVADHDGVDVEGFTLYQNGVAKSTMTAAQAGCSGAVSCSPAFSYLAGLPKGTYVFYMEAFNTDPVTGAKQAAGSTTLTLSVTAGPPKAPVNLRIVKGAP